MNEFTLSREDTMRRLVSLTLTLILLCGGASVAAAQVTADGTAPAERVLRIDKWVTEPVPITLSPEQRVRFDSIRSRYIEDSAELQEALRESRPTEMETMFRVQRLGARYQNLVRAILTDEQKRVFDENVSKEKPGG